MEAKKGETLLRRQWINQALREEMVAIDANYKWQEVCIYYGIPKTSLRDHMSGRTTLRKMRSYPILNKEEEEELLKYL